jgi:hypothetical protein
MASSNPEFYDASRFTAEGYEPPRERGCFFYGCIIASVLAILLLIAVAVGFYLVYRALNQLVDEYTATAPRELPSVELPADERQTLRARFDAFRKAIDAGTPAESLVLSADDINALLEDDPNLKGKIYVTMEGDKLKGQISIPLGSIGLPMLSGRYLNGEAELKASLSEGVLIVTLESIEVNGKKPPQQFLDSIRRQNLAQDAYKDPKNAERIRKLESIEIKDGKIIIKARVKESGAAGRLPELPKEVLAPPADDSTPARNEPSKTP